MKLVLGCDDAGQPLMDAIKAYLKEHPELEVTDFGWNDKEGEYYPDVAERVSVAIAEGEFERGILDLRNRAGHGDHRQQNPRRARRNLPRCLLR